MPRKKTSDVVSPEETISDVSASVNEAFAQDAQVLAGERSDLAGVLIDEQILIEAQRADVNEVLAKAYAEQREIATANALEVEARIADERKIRYVAARQQMIGGREVQRGELVPEASDWMHVEAWVRSGHLLVVSS